MVAGDAFFMRKALAIAERGRGQTSPNPMVGALVVDDAGVIVGRGAHAVAGGPHAEVLALRDAGARARGATLYCTLEPCAHTGRTGPCAPLVSAAGVRRAVIAMGDPNPLVHGRGLDHLRTSGVAVDVGVLAAEAAHQNEVFLTTIERRRPFVIVKAAMSVDACLAEASGVRTALTGPAANRFVQRQRAEVDAIAVGSGTVLADDPLLTPRGAFRRRPLARVIFDRRLRTPADARVFSTIADGPIIVIACRAAADANGERAAMLERGGARVVLLPDAGPLPALEWLLAQGITSVVVEGGARLHRAFFDAGVVDAVQVYIAPRQLGPGGMKWMEAGRLSLAELHRRRARWLREDVLVEGYVHGNR